MALECCRSRIFAVHLYLLSRYLKISGAGISELTKMKVSPNNYIAIADAIILNNNKGIREWITQIE